MNRTDNYPDDIRCYDHDPRSPFYDDGGEEAWKEERINELLEDENNSDFVSAFELGNKVLAWYYNTESTPEDLAKELDKYIYSAAKAKSDREWKDKKYSHERNFKGTE